MSAGPGAPERPRVSGWRDRAACLGKDPELFFPVGTTGPALDQAEQAKAVCRVCPVAAHCLEYALYSRQEAGIWGGLDEEERRVLRRARQARKTRRDQARGWRDADGGQG